MGVLDKDRVSRLLSVHLSVMLSVWSVIIIMIPVIESAIITIIDQHRQYMMMVRYLQFYQPMVLNSLVVSLIPVAILSLQVGN